MSTRASIRNAKGKVTYAAVVGRVIRLRRELQGISLDVMASKLGFDSSSAWSRTETGETSVNVTKLREAALILGVQPGLIIQAADELAKELM